MCFDLRTFPVNCSYWTTMRMRDGNGMRLRERAGKNQRAGPCPHSLGASSSSCEPHSSFFSQFNSTCSELGTELLNIWTGIRKSLGKNTNWRIHGQSLGDPGVWEAVLSSLKQNTENPRGRRKKEFWKGKFCTLTVKSWWLGVQMYVWTRSCNSIVKNSRTRYPQSAMTCMALEPDLTRVVWQGRKVSSQAHMQKS